MSKKTNNYQKAQNKCNKIQYNMARTVPKQETLLDRLKKEVSEFKELMNNFHQDCGVKYGPRTIQNLFYEIKQYSDSDQGYGRKWIAKDYKGAIEDLRYAIDCLNFLAEIASVETMQYLIPQLKADEEYNAYEKVQVYIDDQIKELELIISQIELDRDSLEKGR